jgi:L-malate glycosyltransferase
MNAAANQIIPKITSSPMRIALLGPATSIHLQRWAHALVQRGHAVCVISHEGSVGYFRNAWALRRTFARWRPQLLNAHYASGYGTTAALCGFKPLLLSVWGSDVYDFPYESWLKGQLLRWNLKRATHLASTSHAMAQQVQRLLPELGPNHISVTPFGVDLQHFFPATGPHAAARLTTNRLTTDQLTIGIVKTLAPKYGVDLLLRAFAGLLRDAQIQALPATSAGPLQLLIVGDGPQRDALHTLARELGISAHTEFAGAVPHADVPQWLKRFDIYAAPSRVDSESFGVAVIEASACGLPVVVSDAGGLPEVVRHGHTGFVVPRENVLALQAALKNLALNAALRHQLGQQGRVHVEQLYEWDHCVDVMEQCYRQLLAR